MNMVTEDLQSWHILVLKKLEIILIKFRVGKSINLLTFLCSGQIFRKQIKTDKHYYNNIDTDRQAKTNIPFVKWLWNYDNIPALVIITKLKRGFGEVLGGIQALIVYYVIVAVSLITQDSNERGCSIQINLFL